MTRENMISILGNMVGEDEDTDVLSTYLDLAGDAILNRAYPYKTDWDNLEVPARYHRLQCEIAAFLLNKRGAEGQTAHGENGITRSYGSADIPDDMLSGIVPYVGVIGR